MTAHVFAATNIGFKGRIIEVECDASNGLPGLVIVGLGNKAIEEAKDRVRSAIKNSGLQFPTKRITINLAPANLPKDGAHFDLSIALALLVISGQLEQSALKNTLAIGELSLDGTLRPVAGIIGHAEATRDAKLNAILLPAQNAAQAGLVQDIKILPARSLREVYLHLSNKQQLAPAVPTEITFQKPKMTLNDIQGQEAPKRALVIAAAGHHNLLLSGPPGSGKTMLAQAVRSILPPMPSKEILEVTKLYSLAGETYEKILTNRPFRSPHHSASHIALTGGGRPPRPGEISLAHRGVLFLDELPEYSRQALESLRQPLEDRRIHIARVNERSEFPADFMLVATQNPCPCGYAGDPDRDCSCTAARVIQYQKKISGPLLDRIDMVLEVPRLDPAALLKTPEQNSSQPDFIKMVESARQAQLQRFGSETKTNSHLPSKNIGLAAKLSQTGKTLLDRAAQNLKLSARSYFKVIKVARTIADVEASPQISPEHIAEALQYRPRF